MCMWAFWHLQTPQHLNLALNLLHFFVYNIQWNSLSAIQNLKNVNFVMWRLCRTKEWIEGWKILIYLYIMHTCSVYVLTSVINKCWPLKFVVALWNNFSSVPAIWFWRLFFVVCWPRIVNCYLPYWSEKTCVLCC